MSNDFDAELDYCGIVTTRKFEYNIFAENLEKAFIAACDQALRDLGAMNHTFPFTRSFAASLISETDGYLIDVRYLGPVPR